MPLDDQGLTVSRPVDQTFNFNFNFTLDSNGTKGLAFTVNGVTYKSPKLPTLLRVLSGASESSDFDPSENAVIVKPGALVEINVTGFPDHPFHLQCVSLLSPSLLRIHNLTLTFMKRSCL